MYGYIFVYTRIYINVIVVAGAHKAKWLWTPNWYVGSDHHHSDSHATDTESLHSHIENPGCPTDIVQYKHTGTEVSHIHLTSQRARRPSPSSVGRGGGWISRTTAESPSKHTRARAQAGLPKWAHAYPHNHQCSRECTYCMCRCCVHTHAQPIIRQIRALAYACPPRRWCTPQRWLWQSFIMPRLFDWFESCFVTLTDDATAQCMPGKLGMSIDSDGAPFFLSRGTAYPIWSDVSENYFKVRSSKLACRFSPKRGKRDVWACLWSLRRASKNVTLNGICCTYCQRQTGKSYRGYQCSTILPYFFFL